MPVLSEDHRTYAEFVKTQAKALHSFDFDPECTVWHYTTGAGLIGIVESGALHATQVACVNDSSEVSYASRILYEAYAAKEDCNDAATAALRRKIKTAFVEQPNATSNAPSKWFVICFSCNEDDLSQWRSYCEEENAYAIGFRAKGLFGYPNNIVVKVNYDRKQHEAVAADVVDATIRFYNEGLENKRADSAEQWADEFLDAWFGHIEQLAPLVKDPGFAVENEYRIVHELQPHEYGNIRFRQKHSLMSRYLPLRFPLPIAPRYSMLPITGVRVGPSRHSQITRVSVDTLLAQAAYGRGLVQLSSIPFQTT